MLDGKPSYMSGRDVVNYLTNLPAGNIDLVENYFYLILTLRVTVINI